MNEVIIRGSLRKQILVLAMSIGFVVVGCLMVVLPPPKSSVLPWSSAGQSVIGLLALLFGGIGLIVMIYAATRPILLIRADRLTDCRRKLDVPFADVRSLSTERLHSGQTVQWIELEMHDPQKYAAFEQMSKRSGLSQADLTLDLSLASPADFEQARQSILIHIGRH